MGFQLPNSTKQGGRNPKGEVIRKIGLNTLVTSWKPPKKLYVGMCIQPLFFRANSLELPRKTFKKQKNAN